jgi:hypothetical protein
MAKAGQHENDGLNTSKPRGHEHSRGPNKPSQTQEITTGTPKKKETYAAQARAHTDPGKPAQHSINPWNDDIREQPVTTHGSPRARDSDIGNGRSGSQSNKS